MPPLKGEGSREGEQRKRKNKRITEAKKERI